MKLYRGQRVCVPRIEMFSTKTLPPLNEVQFPRRTSEELISFLKLYLHQPENGYVSEVFYIKILHISTEIFFLLVNTLRINNMQKYLTKNTPVVTNFKRTLSA